MMTPQTLKILVINPNTSVAITDTFKPIISKFNAPNNNIKISYWTCPTGPPIIKTQAQMYESAAHCIPLLLDIADNFDGFLATCYADHPLVRLLQSYVGSKPVVGIFDASIVAALQLSNAASSFGIITTGVPYEALLSEGVVSFLRGNEKLLAKFSGVAASGISMEDLLPEWEDIAKQKIIAATRRLLRTMDNTDVLVMGGVILAGMEGWVHEACELELGLANGNKVKVVDQLLAGMVMLEGFLQNKTADIDFSRALG
jgi:Asp/Glu/hydantoin racemase